MKPKTTQLLSANLEKEIRSTLYEVLADMDDEKETEAFVRAFFSEAELAVFSKRLAIAYFLHKHHTYQEITKALRVSTATVSSVAERMNEPGFQLALQKITTQSWAKKLSNKVLRVFKTLE